MKLRLFPLLFALALFACVRTDVADPPAPDASIEPPPPPPPMPARTTLEPPPGPFNCVVTVTLTADKPATIFVTTDGSDPRTSATARSAASPMSLTLEETSILAFFSRTAEGADESTQTAEYVRAGGLAGSVSGVVIVGEVAAGIPIFLAIDGRAIPLSPDSVPGELPFAIEDLDSGAHRLTAFADRNGDGVYLPFVDLQSPAFEFELDLADPFRASVEDVSILLAQSQPELCTIKGTVTFTNPVPGQTLMVAALSPDALSGGGEGGLGGLFAQLNSGYKVITNDTDTVYPYVITDLEPGSYLPVPALGNIGNGLALNLIASLASQRTLFAGEEAVVDFKFGAVSLQGSATLQPAETQPFAYGVVAARNVSIFTMSVQAVLMPTFYMGSESGLRGSFGGKALRENERFDVRAFSNLDPADPFTTALGWALTPFAPEPAHATFMATPPSVQLDFVAAAAPAP